MLRHLRNLFILCAVTNNVYAQGNDMPSFQSLNQSRIHTSREGMMALGSWGSVNLVGGFAGALASTSAEQKSFHTMNAIWGAANLGIALAGYFSAKREGYTTYEPVDAYRRYESTKRLFLINGGLDLAYIGTGLYLGEHARSGGFNKPEMWQGYGRSLIIQGAFLFLFDSIMYGLHQHQDKNWYRLMKGLSFNTNGINPGLQRN